MSDNACQFPKCECMHDPEGCVFKYIKGTEECLWPDCGCDPLKTTCYKAARWRRNGGKILDQ